MNRLNWPESNNPLDSITWTLAVGGALAVIIVVIIAVVA
jgi:hypothetical protein